MKVTKDIIIDAHVHLPWQDEFATIDEKIKELKRTLADNGVEYAVVIADSELESCIGANDEVIQALSKEDKLFCLFGYTPLERQKEQLDQAEAYFKQGLIKGIKVYPGHENFTMNDRRLKPVFDLCIKYNSPLAVHTEWSSDAYPQYSHPLFISEIAKLYPDLNIVCCHMWLSKALFCFEMIKDLPNVYIDVSSFMMGEEMIKKYQGFPDLDKAVDILETITAYCEDRIFFGSDYGSLSMEDHLLLVAKWDAHDAVKRKVLFENANRLYRLGLDQESRA